MSNENELLEKVISTTTVGADSGGILNPVQSARFIDYMWDATVLAKEGRIVRMAATQVDIDKVSVGSRLVRVATEATDDGVNSDATFTKVSLTSRKLRLDFELSSESLEDNIEGEALEDHIASLMASQFGNDVEDLAINGDTTLTGDPLLKAFDGFKKLGLNNAHVVAGGGATLSGNTAVDGKALFDKAIKALPRKYFQRRNQLRFYTGSNLQQNYLYGLTNIATSPYDIAGSILQGNPVAPNGPAGNITPLAFGIPVKEVPLFSETLSGTYSAASGNHGYIELTFPQNRIWGIKRDVTVYREFKNKKDAIEYTVYVRTGVQVENQDAVVVVKDVKVT